MRPEMASRQRGGIARVLSRQGLDERTVGTPTARTLGDGLPEDTLHGSEVRDLGLHILQVHTGHDPDLSAGPFTLISELEKRPDFLDGKAERPGSADEREAPEVGAAVSPVARGTPGRNRKESSFLVVTDRLDVAARLSG